VTTFIGNQARGEWSGSWCCEIYKRLGKQPGHNGKKPAETAAGSSERGWIKLGGRRGDQEGRPARPPQVQGARVAVGGLGAAGLVLNLDHVFVDADEGEEQLASAAHPGFQQVWG